MQRRKITILKKLYRWHILLGVLFGIIHAIIISLNSSNNQDYNGQHSITAEDEHYKQFPKQLKPGFLVVGVMTAARYLATRAVAVNATWASSIPGSVLFFSSLVNKDHDKAAQLPLVHLKSVNDTYPPQRKSFLMLRYLHDQFIDRFQWFMRADDDVYIRGDRLGDFLSRLDSDKPYYIGQSGDGRTWEREELDFSKNWKYCMGGPGVILSRGLLRQLNQYIPKCMTELFTSHEDTEIGRCIYRYLGVSCTPSKIMKSLFHHIYQTPNESFFIDLNHVEINNAISLHPVKNSRFMYRIHAHFQGQHLLQKLTKQFEVVLFIHKIFTSNKKTKQLTTSSLRDVTWYPFNKQFRYVNAEHILRRRLTLSELTSVQHLSDVMRKYYYNTDVTMKVSTPSIIKGYMLMNGTNEINYDITTNLRSERKRFMLKRYFGKLQVAHIKWPLGTTLSIILPLSGKTMEFKTFLSGFRKTYTRFYQHFPSMRLRLLVIGFSDGPNCTENHQIIKLFCDSNPDIIIIFREMFGPFSRGRALNFGAQNVNSLLKEESVLIFMDVDIQFNEKFLVDVIYHTHRSKQVYFPIVFSQFNKAVVCNSGTHLCEMNRSDDYNSDPTSGYWRIFGYGIVSIYESDFLACKRFDPNLEGWGNEDVDLFEKILMNTTLTVFRAVQPNLVHVYHEQSCSANLEAQQKKMCFGSLLSNLGSKPLLTALLKYSELESWN